MGDRSDRTPTASQNPTTFDVGIRTDPEIDENGDDYAHWVIKRSFAMLGPICRMGLVIALFHLVVVDPMFYSKGFWQKNPYYFDLFIWHAVVVILFAGTWVGARGVSSHIARTGLLIAFFISCSAIFAWFGFISWFLLGDLSLYAVALLCLSSVFLFPGPIRRVVSVLSALGLAGSIVWWDPRTLFIDSGVFLNLIAMVAIAFVIDGYMVRTSRALFREMCKVEAERLRADAVLYNALPKSIADDLKLHRTVKAEKYQNMTVMFADIVGFTHYASHLPPDELVEVLNQIFTDFDALVDKYAVEKIKTIGDAYMVIGKGNAADVPDLAFDMLAAIARYNALNGGSFQLRLGVNIGPTVAGVIGLKRFLYDVWGDAVNMASRLESTGEPGRVHVSESVANDLRDEYDLEDRGQIDIKGKGSMQTYFQLGRKQGAVAAASRS